MAILENNYLLDMSAFPKYYHIYLGMFELDIEGSNVRGIIVV